MAVPTASADFDCRNSSRFNRLAPVADSGTLRPDSNRTKIVPRGAQGGYQLARVAASISAAEIIDAIEGPVAITECSGIHSACDLETVCSTGNAWQRVNAAIRRSLDEISLAQLSGQEAVAVWRPELKGAIRPTSPGRPGGRH